MSSPGTSISPDVREDSYYRLDLSAVVEPESNTMAASNLNSNTKSILIGESLPDAPKALASPEGITLYAITSAHIRGS